MIINPEAHNVFTFIFNELNVYAFCVWMFLFCIALAIVVTLLTPKPKEEQIRGLCFGTATPEQKAETRASWGTWDIIHTCIILAFTVAFYIYFW
jgi:SSS family solute:Na+ symporter